MTNRKPWLARVLGLSLPLILVACGNPTTDTVRTAGSETRIEDQAAPAPRGLDSTALAALDARLAELAATQQRSGFAAIVARDGAVQHISETGFANVEAATPMTADTIVRIASMSKPVTAVAVMMLIEEGVIALDDPVSTYIPSFANFRVATSTERNAEYEIPTEPLVRPITIEDLLTHTSGIGYIFDYETNLGALYIGNSIYEGEGDLTARMERLTALPLYFQPGTRWFYSFSSDVLGHVVEVASGQRLEAFMQERIFGPLAMENTTFFPTDAQRASVATLYTHGEDGSLLPIPPEADAVLRVEYEGGGAGLLSTANDYLRFAQMLANGGELDGVRILSNDTVAAMIIPHVRDERMPPSMAALRYGYGLGVGVRYEGELPQGAPPTRPGDFGWGGYFDTSFFVSPATGVVAVIMAQEQPGPTSDETVGSAVFAPLVYAAIGEEIEG